ncbi:hypothetical protein M3Y97_00682600 [Aphelenchoides bicaudatus]|nr:hypothetical protein M3Y97_00682600 [Aphelenchoides bicaudatus]
MAYNAAKNPAIFGWYTLFARFASILSIVALHVISPIQINVSSTNPNVQEFLTSFSAIISNSTLHGFLTGLNIITFIGSVFVVMGLKERSRSYFVPLFVLAIIAFVCILFYNYYMTDFICTTLFYSTARETSGLEYFGRGILFFTVNVLVTGFTSTAAYSIMADSVCEEFGKIRAEEKAKKASNTENV